MKNNSLILVFLFILVSLFGNEDIFFMSFEEILENDTSAIQKIEDYKNTLIKPDYKTYSQNEEIPVEMIILTNEDLAGDLDDFLFQKKTEGINAELVLTSETSTDSTEIRNYLSQRKIENPDLRYLLIVGDETIVPSYKVRWETDNQYEPFKDFSSDYYYSNVTRFWPESIDENDDIKEIEIFTDLIVGRIPVKTNNELQTFLEKYKTYKFETKEAGKKWSFIANNLLRQLGNTSSSNIIELILDNVDSSVEKEFVKEIDLVSSEPFDTLHINDFQGAAGKFLEYYNQEDFSLNFMIAHGNEDNYAIYDYYTDDDDGHYNFDGHAMYLTVDEQLAFEGEEWFNYPAATFLYLPLAIPDNIIQPDIFIPVSCESANLYSDDVDEPAAQVMFNQKGGPISVYNSSCSDNPYFTKNIIINVFQNHFANKIDNYGELINSAWEALPEDYLEFLSVREILFSHHLFGDPTINIWSEKPKNLTIQEKADTIRVYNENGKVEDNVKITLLQNGEIVSKGITPFDVSFHDSEDYIVSANKMNSLQEKNNLEKILNPQKLPYFIDFEEGLDSHFKINSKNALGNIHIVDKYSAISGEKVLVMENFIDSSNLAEIAVDLENSNRVYLSFHWKEFSDENNSEDGIYLSDDSGTNYSKIYSFDSEASQNGTWQFINLNLDEICAENNLEYNSDFRILFSHRGDDLIFQDGFAFDDIHVYKNYAPSDFSTSFEENSDFWEFKSTNSGALKISEDYSPYSDNKHLLFSNNSEDSPSINKALLYCDLSDLAENEELSLNFYLKKFDDETDFEDGLFVSDDGGNTYTKIFEYYDFVDYSWQEVNLNLTEICEENNIELNSDFVIKFQQKDDFPVPTDGIAIDDFSLIKNVVNIQNDVNEVNSVVLENYPNPFVTTNSRDTQLHLKFDSEDILEKPKMKIFNIKGQIIKEIKLNEDSSGDEVIWNGKDRKNRKVSTGIYFYQLMNKKRVLATKKLLLIN